MTITIEAVYENGVLKPSQPLPFAERDRVQVTVHAQRLRSHPAEVMKLQTFRHAIAQIAHYHIQVLTIGSHLIEAANIISQQTGLLTNDAVVVAVMREHGITNLASHDADFDRVPGIARYSPA